MRVGSSPIFRITKHQMLSSVIWVAFFVVFTRKTKLAVMLTCVVWCPLLAWASVGSCGQKCGQNVGRNRVLYEQHLQFWIVLKKIQKNMKQIPNSQKLGIFLLKKFFQKKLNKNKKVLDSIFCLLPPISTYFHLLSPIFYPLFAQKYIKRVNDIIENRNTRQKYKKGGARHGKNTLNGECRWHSFRC